MTQSHPFFGIHGGVGLSGKIPVLRTTYKAVENQAGQRLFMEIKWLDLEIEVGGLAEAEDKFLDLILQTPIRETFKAVDRNYLALNHTITRQCTYIGQRTRRGAGNIILVNPDRISFLITEPYCAYEALEPKHFGNWTMVGRYNSFSDVYVSPKIPFDRVIPIYKGSGGEADAAAHFTVTDDGKSFLNLLHPDEESFAETSAYVSQVAIED